MSADDTGPRASLANQCDRMGFRRRQTVELRHQELLICQTQWTQQSDGTRNNIVATRFE